MGLIDAEELAALGEFVADGFFRSQIEIYQTSDEDDVTPPTMSWDDSVETSITEATEPTVTVEGWFRNQPDYQTSDAFEAIAYEEDGRLFLPLGTALSRSDMVKVYPIDEAGVVSDTGTAYRVIDTNFENSYRILVRASLKRVA